MIDKESRGRASKHAFIGLMFGYDVGCCGLWVVAVLAVGCVVCWRHIQYRTPRQMRSKGKTLPTSSVPESQKLEADEKIVCPSGNEESSPVRHPSDRTVGVRHPVNQP
jgi:hypothetical protein